VDGSHEPIAALRKRLDPLLAAGRLRQHPADRVHLYRQVALFDDDARPRRPDEAVLRQELVGVLDEHRQDADCPRAEHDRRPGPRQCADVRVKPKRSDVVDPGHQRRRKK